MLLLKNTSRSMKRSVLIPSLAAASIKSPQVGNIEWSSQSNSRDVSTVKPCVPWRYQTAKPLMNDMGSLILRMESPMKLKSVVRPAGFEPTMLSRWIIIPLQLSLPIDLWSGTYLRLALSFRWAPSVLYAFPFSRLVRGCHQYYLEGFSEFDAIHARSFLSRCSYCLSPVPYHLGTGGHSLLTINTYSSSISSLHFLLSASFFGSFIGPCFLKCALIAPKSRIFLGFNRRFLCFLLDMFHIHQIVCCTG